MADDPIDPAPSGPGLSRRHTFSAFRHRNYRLFFFGQLVSVIGTAMQGTALPWLVYTTTQSALWLGIVAALTQLPSLFLWVFVGALVDRLPKRELIVCTQSAAMCLAFTLAALVHWQVVRVWHIAAIALASGLVLAIDIPARQSFVVEMVGREDLMNAIALNSSCFNMGRILGPVSAGFLILIGMDWCFFLNGLSFVAVIGGLLLMHLPPWQPSRSRPPILAHTIEGIRYARSQPRIVIALTMMATVAVFGLPYQTLTAVFAHDVLRVGAKGMGLMGGAVGVGALASTLILARRQRPTWTLFLGVMLAMAGGLYCYGLSKAFRLSLAILVGVGACSVAFTITCNTTLQLASPDAMRGRVMGLYAMSFVGLGPIGSFLSGALANWQGAPRAVCLNAAICATVGTGVALWLKAHRAGIGAAVAR